MSSTRYGKRCVGGSGVKGQQWALVIACTVACTAISTSIRALGLAVCPFTGACVTWSELQCSLAGFKKLTKP